MRRHRDALPNYAMKIKHLKFAIFSDQSDLQIFCIIFSVIMILIAVPGCAGPVGHDPDVVNESLQKADGEEGIVMEFENSSPDSTRPPIDEAVPGELATATLAMG
jgi:hypothetical protein